MYIFKFRRIISGIKILAFIALFISCEIEPNEENSITELNFKTSGRNTEVVKDQYIVLVSKKPVKKDTRAEEALEALSKEVGNMKGARVKGIYKSALTGFVAKLDQFQLKKLENDPRVVSVIEDRYVKLENISESFLMIQEYPVYGLDRLDQRGELMDRAYSYTSTGAGVTAYIIDTGIRSSHNEFNGRVSLGFDFVLAYPDPNDVIDPNGAPGEDCHGHGTHVAGTVGGATYGVSKEVDLVNLRVFGCTDGSPYSRIIHAIDWVTANAKKPAVVNMSLGDPVEDIEVFSDIAVQNSIASGITYVIAGGNSSMDACDFSPARVPEAISVGASDIENQMAYFSNYGNCLDVFAPGHRITSAFINDDNSVATWSGTSMAAPHVAGIAALYLSENPTATPAQVHDAVVQNATPSAITGAPSGPTSLAHSLWEPVDFVPPVQPNLGLNGNLIRSRGEYLVELNWNLIGNSSYVIYQNGIEIDRTGIVNTYSDNLGKVRDATYTYRVCEILYDNCSEITIVVGDGGETTNPVNSAPSADFTFETNLLEVQFSDSSYDTDGSISNWAWNFGDGNTSSVQNPSHSYFQAGTYEVSLTVTDDGGSSNTATRSVSVSDEPQTGGLQLSATGYKVKGKWQADLAWEPSGSSSSQIEIYRNGVLISTVSNTGNFTDQTEFKGSGSLEYQVCEPAKVNCSNSAGVEF